MALNDPRRGANDKPAVRENVFPVGVKIVLAATVTFGGGFLVAMLAKVLNQSGTFRSEIILPIIVVYGVVSLLLTLGVLVSILNEYGLVHREEALGLPPGSIRAAIALILLLVFIIISLYVLSVGTTSTANPQTIVVVLPTPEETGASASTALPGGPSGTSATPGLASPTPTALVGAPTSPPAPPPTTAPLPSSEAGRQPVDKDIAIQILTTVGTLAVAVSAFYFGSKAGEGGGAKGGGGPGPETQTSAGSRTDGDDSGGPGGGEQPQSEQRDLTSLTALLAETQRGLEEVKADLQAARKENAASAEEFPQPRPKPRRSRTSEFTLGANEESTSPAQASDYAPQPSGQEEDTAAAAHA